MSFVLATNVQRAAHLFPVTVHPRLLGGVDEDGDGELAWMTSISDVVLLVRVQTIEPKVTNEQDWITSKVSALVRDVRKDRPTASRRERR